MKGGTGEDPNEDDEHSPAKGPGTAKHDGRMARENTECVAYDAKEIAFLFAVAPLLDLGFVHKATLTFAPEFPIARTKRASRFLSSAWQD